MKSSDKKPEIKTIMSGSIQDFELTLIRSCRRRAEGQLIHLDQEEGQLNFLLKRVLERIKEIPKEREKLNKQIEKNRKEEVKICGYVEPDMQFKFGNSKIKEHAHGGCAGGVIHTSKDWPLDQTKVV